MKVFDEYGQEPEPAQPDVSRQEVATTAQGDTDAAQKNAGARPFN
jgi:hypothetical protein